VATRTTRFGQGNIDPQRWDRLKTILGEALEHDSSAARIVFVERCCGQDTDLLEEAESLLAEAEALLEERTDRFEDCAQNAASTFWQEGPPRGGQRVGAYVIVRELGRGGMGTVFLAERADGQNARSWPGLITQISRGCSMQARPKTVSPTSSWTTLWAHR
jgi:hypothetical protein